MFKKEYRIFLFLAQALVLAIVFFTPLYFAVWPRGANVYELNKMVLFRVLVVILFWAVLADWLFGGGEAATKEEVGDLGSRPQTRKILLAKDFFRRFLFWPTVFLFTLSVATILSIDPSNSFFGSYARGQGLVSYWFYFLFFILLLFVLRSERFVKRILKTAVISSFLVCLYGLVQAAGFDPLVWNTSPFSYSGRIAATLGQPNFLASYLLLVIPLTIYFLICARNFWPHFLWFIVLISQLFCLFLTYSRAGWLGLVVGAAVVGVIRIWELYKEHSLKFNRRYLKFSLIITLGIIFLITSFGLILKNLDNNIFLKRRLSSFVNLEKGSLPARIQLWRASLKAIKKRPWRGYGLENQGEPLLPYYTKEMSIHSGINIYPDRAHNLILDIWLSGGLAAVLSFLALLIFLFSLLLGSIRRGQNQLIAYTLLAALAGYFFSLLFGFSVVVTEVYFWLYLAIIISLSSGLILSQQSELAPAKLSSDLAVQRIGKIFFLAITGAAVLIFSFTQIQKLAADYFFRQIQVASSSRNLPLALLAYSYLEKLPSGHSSYYNEAVGYMLANQILESPLVVGNFSLEDLEKIKDKIKPHSFFSRLSQARLNIVLAAKGDLKVQAEVKKEWEGLIKTSPQFPKLYYDFGRFLERQRQYGKAIEEWQIGLGFLPEISDPRLSREHRQAVREERARFYLAMARAWQQVGKNDLAIRYYNLAFRAAPEQTTPLWQMANLYRQQGQDDKALFYARWGWRREPTNFLWPAVISLIYKDTGDEGQAEKYGEIARKLKRY